MLQIDCRKLKLSLHFFEPKGPVCTRGATAPLFKKTSLTSKLTLKFFRAQTNSHMTTAKHNSLCSQLDPANQKGKRFSFLILLTHSAPEQATPLSHLQSFSQQNVAKQSREHKRTPRQSSSAFTCPAHRQMTSQHTGHGYLINTRLALHNS